ncbi:hypothetical protein [Halobellus litoreus]|uniref:Gins51 C-terminal domain-containing protein n=1 Tax=Halobellus litoreus TaxID=755310 RepID=A0ABD6DYL5_9EURY|nr:hypothetical protein [Halobellus litoreus]
MNLDELRSVRRTERQKDSLQHLRDSFYGDVADYIAARKAERRRAADAADDPFADPEVGQLTDEIETAEDVVEAIYERRVGKVVKLASFAAADMSADTNGLTAEERDLFENLVSRIKQNRQSVLDVLAGEGGDGTGGEAAPETDRSEPATAAADRSDPRSAESTTADPSAASPNAAETEASTDREPISPDDVLTEAMGGGDAPPAETASAVATADPDGGQAAGGGGSDTGDVPPDVPPDAPPDATETETPVVDDGGEASTEHKEPRTDGAPGRVETARGPSEDSAQTGERTQTERVTLRITQDVGQILGVDEREYDLESEDVVTLPTTNAGPLLDRNAAERLD